jgi:hypothetical protein
MDSQSIVFRHRIMIKMLCKGKDEDAIMVLKLIGLLLKQQGTGPFVRQNMKIR